MQNHHSLLYREEEREMLPLLKVSPCRLSSGESHRRSIDTYLESSAPRRRMHSMEPPGEGFTYQALGRGQRTRGDGRVSFQNQIDGSHDLTLYSWSAVYKGVNGSEAVVQRFVTPSRVKRELTCP